MSHTPTDTTPAASAEEIARWSDRLNQQREKRATLIVDGRYVNSVARLEADLLEEKAREKATKAQDAEEIRTEGWSGSFVIRIGAQLFRAGRRVAPLFTDIDLALTEIEAAGFEVVEFDRIIGRGRVRLVRCEWRVSVAIPRRPANALNVEVGKPQSRCRLRCPDGRGDVWRLSGGSILDYGLCTPVRCPSGGACSTPSPGGS